MSENNKYSLVQGPEGLSLQLLDSKLKPIRVDFVAGALAHRRLFGGGRGQPLARAIGLKHNKSPKVLDVCAGLGKDAFVLASLGCQVHLVERNPLVAALLEDGLQRARESLPLKEIMDRMTFEHVDASEWLRKQHDFKPDVIYMDPMFPERQKSALVKKEMRAFHDVVGKDLDAGELLLLAINSGCKRVVVKRPRLAPVIESSVSPSAVIMGKNTRYDLYLR